ncbi:MAG: hypothetical protein ACFB14_11360 [Leptolyngbyaceae cyanobacterium]
MSTTNKTLSAVGRAIQRPTVWILEAAKRLFSPNDDDYPNTGVQPFEGDISDTTQQ